MFTNKQFEHYIRLVGATKKCPCCQNEKWRFIAESRMYDSSSGQQSTDPDKNSVTGLVALTVDRSGNITNARLGGIGLAQMLCLNCGHQIMFNYHFVRERYNELLNSDKISDGEDGE